MKSKQDISLAKYINEQQDKSCFVNSSLPEFVLNVLTKEM
jgi:hypothetical protein